MQPTTAIVADPIYQTHVPSPMHPESPLRYAATIAGIRAVRRTERLRWMRPRRATEDELALCHARDYIRIVREDVMRGAYSLRTGDTELSEGSYEAALHAVGGLLEAVDAVAKGQVVNAFCPVRPPGHHASCDCGRGFCIFNNVAVAARYAQVRYGIERVLIADWDVHHGNGTQEIFEADPTVFYFSTHQWPLFPGTGTVHETGTGAGSGFTLNCPVGMGAGRREILGAFRERLLPAMRRFRPEFIFVSAGFDGRCGDYIGNLTLTDDDFAALTRLLMDVADDGADGRLVSVLEGGYELDGLARAVKAHVAALTGGGCEPGT